MKCVKNSGAVDFYLSMRDTDNGCQRQQYYYNNIWQWNKTVLSFIKIYNHGDPPYLGDIH